ncbi:SIMPL domain-containing protein [Xanthomonas sp. Kuri4-1]
MKRIAGWIFASLLMLPLAATAQVNSLPSQPHLLVKGQAFRTVDPDRFIIDLKVSNTDLQPDLARQFVEERTRLVLDGLRRNHVLADSLYASSLSISPQSRYENGKSVFQGTRVERKIRGTFSSLKDVRAFLGGLDANENVQVLSMQSAYADAAALRADLKREAATQSRESAQGLAAAYGVRLGGIYSVSDVAPSFAYGVEAGTWSAATAPRPGSSVSPPSPPAPEAPRASRAGVQGTGESLLTGTITYTENIYAVFLIAQ